MTPETCAPLMAEKNQWGKNGLIYVLSKDVSYFWVVTVLLLWWAGGGVGGTLEEGSQSGYLQPADSPQQITAFSDEDLLLIKALLDFCH